MTPPNRSSPTLLAVLQRLVSSDAGALEAAERETLEQWIGYARRREAAVELAGSVAHDLNNLLTGILGAAEILRGTPPGEQARWEIETIVDGVLKARTLCRQLVSVSRAVARPRQDIDLSELIAQTAALLEHLIGDGIQLQIEQRGEDWTVQADPSELEQVVCNLVLNARDAMPQGGAIQLSAESVDLAPDGVAACPGSNGGRFVRLTVADTGVGMTDEVRARAFEPHFTTKPYGSGLGLHSCLRIVTQLGGRMELESELGRGTVVRVYLPRATE